MINDFNTGNLRGMLLGNCCSIQLSYVVTSSPVIFQMKHKLTGYLSGFPATSRDFPQLHGENTGRVYAKSLSYSA